MSGARAAVGLAVTLGAALLAAPRAQPALDESARLGHLLRRAGFGASADDLAEARRRGLAATVDHLVDYEAVPDDVDRKLDLFFLDKSKLYDVQREWVMRMTWSQRPLQERMVLFWHGLLVSSNTKVGRPQLMQRQLALFREHALADYGTLLKAVWRDPAMLVFLDTHNSRRSAPNENFARELLELFSMGPGHYTERDIREASRAFTGWSMPREANEPIFNPAQHDAGEKRFLGRTVRTPDDVVEAIVAHPATSSFVAAKLFNHFIHPSPTPPEVEPFAKVFRETGGSIREVVRAMLRSEAFYAPAAYRARLKSPAEYAIGVLRQLGVPTDGAGVIERMTRMGQSLLNPPNVAGWPGGRSWLNSGTWIERLNYANATTSTRADGRMLSIVPSVYLQRHELTTADAVLDHLLDLLVENRIGGEARRHLREYLGTELTDEKVRGVVYLILAMPEHQLC